MKKTQLKNISLAAIFTAVIAASAWISVFTPFGINLTLQMFAVCLAGFCLGAKRSFLSVVAYIAIGAAGAPVFSSFGGGFGVLLGLSGGFLWGFLLTVVLCGVSNQISNKYLKIITILLAVLLCHTAGVVQFCFVSGNGVLSGIITASLPFLLKDIIFAFLAKTVANKIRL